MLRTLVAVSALAIVFAPAGFAQQTDAPKFSTKSSTIGQILGNAEAKAAFAKIFPDLIAMPQLDQAREMTIEDVKGLAPDYFSEEKVKALEGELAKIK